MVTAILPSLTDESGTAAEVAPKPPPVIRNSVALSVNSEATVTPDLFRGTGASVSAAPNDGGDGNPFANPEQKGKPPVLAGYVGLFTGCGALVALSLFLPLPARFASIEGVTIAQAEKYSFYVVGTISLAVAVFVFLGLRGLQGEEGKGWRTLFGLHGTAPDGSASRYPTVPKHVR